MKKVTATEKFEVLVLDYIAGRFDSFDALKSLFQFLKRKLEAIRRFDHLRRIENAFWVAFSEMGIRAGI